MSGRRRFTADKLKNGNSQLPLTSSDEIEKGFLKVSSVHGEIMSLPSSSIGTTGQQVDEKKLRLMIRGLVPYSDEYIENLDPMRADTFRQLSENLTYIYSNDIKLYTNIIDKIVVEEFKNCGKPLPRTVGSYFVGCSPQHNNSEQLECSPGCIVGLPHQQEGRQCADLVLSLIHI